MSERSKQPPPRRKWRMILACGSIALLVGVLTWLRSGSESLAQMPASPPPAPAMSPPPVSSDYAQRAVAYLYTPTGEMPITREELGEYLIARYGAEKLELLVNKKIIEEACKAQKIVVSDAEIEADLAETLAGLNVNQKEFIDRVLKAYRKTLYEWKEDVIRPKLMMNKLVQNRVTCTDEDVRIAFDAYHGERVEGRIILWPPEEKRIAQMEYSKLRDSEEAFAQRAKSQASRELSAAGGKIDKPIGHNTTGSPELEKAVFSIQPGDITELVQVPEGWVVFKCDKRLPPDTHLSIQSERERLVKEIIAKKTQIEIAKVFQELKQKSNPRLLLPGAKQMRDLAAEVRKELPPEMLDDPKLQDLKR